MHNQPISHAYFLEEHQQLGEGACGRVVRARHLATQGIVAVKILPKAKNPMMAVREATIMRPLDHPHVAKLLETFEDDYSHYLVLENCSGGDLADMLSHTGYVSEVQSSIIMKQLLGAVRLMQRLRIRHNDLSMVNLMFKSKKPIEQNSLKVIDFGSATRDVLLGGTDMLSCGLLLRALLCAGSRSKARFGARAGMHPQAMALDDRDWNDLSRSGRDLLWRLLEKDESLCISAREAMLHPFIVRKAPKLRPSASGYPLLEKFNRFACMNKVKRAALHVMADRLDGEELSHAHRIFSALDVNGDGLLTLSEIAQGERPGETQYLRSLLQELDADGIGVLDYTAFLAAMLRRKTYMADTSMRLAFAAFDADRDGRLSVQELQDVLGYSVGGAEMGEAVAELTELVAEADFDGDGHLSYQEFVSLIGREDAGPRLDSRRSPVEGRVPLERQALRAAKLRATAKRRDRKKLEAKDEEERRGRKARRAKRRQALEEAAKRDKGTITTSALTAWDVFSLVSKATANNDDIANIEELAGFSDLFADDDSDSDGPYSSGEEDLSIARAASLPVARGSRQQVRFIGIGPALPASRPTAVPLLRGVSPPPSPPSQARLCHAATCGFPGRLKKSQSLPTPRGLQLSAPLACNPRVPTAIADSVVERRAPSSAG